MAESAARTRSRLSATRFIGQAENGDLAIAALGNMDLNIHLRCLFALKGDGIDVRDGH